MHSKATKRRSKSFAVVGVLAAANTLVVQTEAQTDAESAGAELPTGLLDYKDPRNPELEALVWSTLPNIDKPLTSILSVMCSDTECEVVFTGSDDLPDLMRELIRIKWDGRGWPLFKMSSLGRKEISPGAEVRVFTMSTTCPSPKGCELPEGAVP